MSTEPGTTDATLEWGHEIAEREEEHAHNIRQTENDLRAALADAETALHKVGSLLHDLTAGKSWHVEYAEGIDGTDAVRETENAERAVRNVQRIVHGLSGKGDQ